MRPSRPSSTRLLLAASCLVLGSALGCDSEQAEQPPAFVLPEEAPDTLSEWGLFADIELQTPASGVTPYEVKSPLFTDYALKYRFMALPEGETAEYDDDGAWEFPDGSVLVKTFAFPVDASAPESGDQLLETRLLVLRGDEWIPHVYVYNDAGDDAKRKPVGASLDVSYIDAQGERIEQRYSVPNTNACHDCHGKNEDIDTLGGKTRHLNTLIEGTAGGDGAAGGENQIVHFIDLGLLDGEIPKPSARPEMVDYRDEKAPGLDRARAYLDVHCGHCHGPEGGAKETGMFLDYAHTGPDAAPHTYGACRKPDSASGATCGNEYDIVPGDPDASILTCRVASDDPDIMMPPLGRRLVHTEGLEILTAWIAAMDGPDCP